MAITGTGTELDPFIVHSYAEIKTFIEDTTASDLYGKLGNDIDCNTYGVDWEWETITNSSSNIRDFDLDGHTIKNVYIKNSNFMFKGGSQSSRKIVCHNGKLLNVFGGSPQCISEWTDFVNVSMSAQISSLSGQCLFSGSIILENCAMYLVLLNAGAKYITSIGASGYSRVKNTDFYIEFYNCNSSTKIFNRGSSGAICDAVRVKGKMKLPQGATPAAASYWVPVMAITNSVFEVDMTDFAGIESGSSNLIGGTGDNTTVVNWSLVPDEGHLLLNGYLKATNSQMTVGSELRSLGFSVVNIEE